MIRRIREWLIFKFLPVWAKESVYKENEELKEKIAELRGQVRALNSYIDGLETGIRLQRRVVVNNKVGDK